MELHLEHSGMLKNISLLWGDYIQARPSDLQNYKINLGKTIIKPVDRNCMMPLHEVGYLGEAIDGPHIHVRNSSS